MCKINHGAIIFADIPFSESNPHQHYGPHYYVIVANNRACTYSPVVQAVPMTSNCNRRLPCQVEIRSSCLSKTSYALAEQLTLLPKCILEEGQFCGILESNSMKKVEDAIKVQLALV